MQGTQRNNYLPIYQQFRNNKYSFSEKKFFFVNLWQFPHASFTLFMLECRALVAPRHAGNCLWHAKGGNMGRPNSDMIHSDKCHTAIKSKKCQDCYDKHKAEYMRIYRAKKKKKTKKMLKQEAGPQSQTHCYLK